MLVARTRGAIGGGEDIRKGEKGKRGEKKGGEKKGKGRKEQGTLQKYFYSSRGVCQHCPII